MFAKDLFLNNILKEDNSNLKKERNEEEISEASFNMEGNKAPSPNRFPIAVFQRFQNNFKNDAVVLLNNPKRKRKWINDGTHPSWPQSPKKEEVLY